MRPCLLPKRSLLLLLGLSRLLCSNIIDGRVPKTVRVCWVLVCFSGVNTLGSGVVMEAVGEPWIWTLQNLGCGGFFAMQEKLYDN